MVGGSLFISVSISVLPLRSTTFALVKVPMDTVIVRVDTTVVFFVIFVSIFSSSFMFYCVVNGRVSCRCVFRAQFFGVFNVGYLGVTQVIVL